MSEFERMIELLDTSWYLRSQIVPCLVGPSGIGKTAAVMQHAKAHDCKRVVKIVASRCVPSETVGMTMPDHEHRGMTIYNSMQLSSLEDGDILFLDELLEADQYVLSTLLTVIESREMADGTPLPDIQIIAATNDTISPEQLKENIRQRFMFTRFSIDKEATREYILKLTGLKISDAVLNKLDKTGPDYNFLTPRSLTKLCLWVSSVPENKLSNVARVINNMWGTSIGYVIVDARRDRDLESPDAQVRKMVRQICEDDHENEGIPKNFDFENCTFSEMIEVLTKLEYWDELERTFSRMTIKEPDEQEVDISF